MKIELSHNEYGGWVMEITSAYGMSAQCCKDKQDLIKRLSKEIMDKL